MFIASAPGPNLFVITGLIYTLKCSFGTEYFVCYNRVIVITEFVITEFHCTIKMHILSKFKMYSILAFLLSPLSIYLLIFKI